MPIGLGLKKRATILMCASPCMVGGGEGREKTGSRLGSPVETPPEEDESGIAEGHRRPRNQSSFDDFGCHHRVKVSRHRTHIGARGVVEFLALLGK